MGISQDELAMQLGVTRGKIASYEGVSSGKPEFHTLLVDKFDIDLGKFLQNEMNIDNYQSFFISAIQNSVMNESHGEYFRQVDIFDLLTRIKHSTDQEEKSNLIDQATRIYGEILQENGGLKTEIVQLHRDLLKLARS